MRQEVLRLWLSQTTMLWTKRIYIAKPFVCEAKNRRCLAYIISKTPVKCNLNPKFITDIFHAMKHLIRVKAKKLHVTTEPEEAAILVLSG